MKYFEEAKHIWQSFVPESGQADTVQGELLRAVEKLRDGAQRNGNGNWDEGFDMLLAYLESKLSDEKVYPSELITKSKTQIARLKNHQDPYLEDDLYDELTDRVVEYFKVHGSQVHQKNSRLFR